MTEGRPPKGPRGERWVPGDNVVSELAGDNMVLIHMDTNKIFELNRTGARVWELLQDGEDSDGIVRRMGDEFDVERDRLKQEVLSVLERLEREKLVRRNG